MPYSIEAHVLEIVRDAMRRTGGASIRDLVKRTGLQGGQVYGAVRRLVARGELIPNDDQGETCYTAMPKN